MSNKKINSEKSQLREVPTENRGQKIKRNINISINLGAIAKAEAPADLDRINVNVPEIGKRSTKIGEDKGKDIEADNTISLITIIITTTIKDLKIKWFQFFLPI